MIAAPVKESREYRKTPEDRLMARTGLKKYETEAPLTESLQEVEKVRLLFSQHIGTPSVCSVAKGEQVACGQVIAQSGSGLSVPVHASIDGMVSDVTDIYAEIVRI
jgi:Na+-translocating ferredoxin:NAD+ oxidoreductase RnfC subunit